MKEEIKKKKKLCKNLRRKMNETLNIMRFGCIKPHPLFFGCALLVSLNETKMEKKWQNLKWNSVKFKRKIVEFSEKGRRTDDALSFFAATIFPYSRRERKEKPNERIKYNFNRFSSYSVQSAFRDKL